MSDKRTDRVSLEQFGSSPARAFIQGVRVSEMVARNSELLAPAFNGITERYAGWYKATRSVRRAAMSNVVDASVVLLGEKPIGVATSVGDRPVNRETARPHRENEPGFNIAYWLDEQRLKQSDTLSLHELHSRVARLALRNAVIRRPGEYAWALLPSDGSTDPSRGLREFMRPLGDPGDFGVELDDQAISMADDAAQLFIVQQ